MREWAIKRAGGAALLALLFLPGTGLAQSAIAGRVTDNTGGVMPGVTVEASSPALIEGARVAITDGTGQYQIVNLRPGTYTVTFSLPGFITQVRDALELPADFTMTVNIVMAVGAIEETVTVSGASPVVDTQTVRRTEVLSRELAEEIPTGRALWSYAVLMPGVSIGRPDVGGTSGHQQVGITGAGAGDQAQRDSVYEIDGLDVSMYIGENWMPYLNPMLVAETSYTTAGIDAETQRGGVRMNMVPKEGGNITSGSFFVGGSPTSGWQSDNWTPRLGDLGVPSRQAGDAQDGIPHIDRLYDLNFEIGGPIVQNRLWYHASSRRLVVNNQVLNSVKRDGSQGLDTNSLTDGAVRLTWQVTDRNKLSAGFDKLRKRRFTQHTAGEDVDTASTRWTSPHYDTGTVKWTSTVSSRLLAEFGYSLSYQDWDPSYQEGIRRERPAAFVPCPATPCFPAVGSAAALAQMDPNGWYGVTNHNDQRLQLAYGAATNETENYPHAWSYKGSLSYVTGSHNIKVGFQNKWGNQRRNRNNNAHLIQLYTTSPNPWGNTVDFVGADHFAAAENLDDGLPPGLIGTPNQVTVYNNPVTSKVDIDYDVGVFAQDSWTMNRLTIGAGLRMDVAKTSVPSVPSLGGRFTPIAALPAVDLPRFGPDFSPRLSVAYDLFGDGKTALKAGWNRYMSVVAEAFPNNHAPAFFTQDTRNWFDLALDSATGGLPAGCTLANPAACPNPYGTNGDNIAQDWEIGRTGNQSFGIRSTNRVDPDIERQYNDQWMAGVQHELLQGVSVSATYRRRVDRDRDSGDNVLRTFDSFTSTVDVARPAPYVGSFTIFNIDPAQRAALDILDRTVSSDLFSTVYNSFELAGSARLPGGGRLVGGWVVSRTTEDNCQDELIRGDNPNNLRFCDQNAFPVPYRHELKLSGSLPFSLPMVGELNTGFAILGIPGSSLGEAFRYSRSTANNNQTLYVGPFFTEENCVAPCVLNGRIVTTPTVGISPLQFDATILPANSVKFFPRLTQVDFNIAKVFRLRGWRYDVRLEMFNLLNNSADRTHAGVTATTATFQTAAGVLGTDRGLGTSAGAQSLALYERATNIIDARVFRIAVTGRF